MISKAMAHGEDNPLAQVMEALRAKLDGRAQAAADVAQKLHAAADRYERAVQAGAAADLARQHGLDAPAVDCSPEDAARDLKVIIDALPELANTRPLSTASPEPKVPAREEPDVTPPPPASFGDLMAKSAPSNPRPERAPPREQADPEVLRLVSDMRGYELPALPTPLFRAVAEELAARARDLQERGVADPDNKLGLVFRALTKCAYDHGTTNIFGLSRQHQGDWRQKAIEARERRLRLEAGEPDSLRQRIQIPKAIVDQVTNGDDDDDDDDDEVELWELPRLTERAADRAVVLLGGVRKPEKLDKLHQRIDFDVEWIETSAGSTGSTSTLERRIREGNVAAVVILHGLIGHKHYEPVVAAARQACIPVAYGGRAGTASLRSAFEEIETGLG
ncbi:MAG: hypothetical protein KJ015_00435 [Myxococcales bacterium]|nr:hypothetical protein [Myxococcales bacterium]